MRDYFIRRFLLIIPTVLGATLVVFFLTRIVPGGPLEAAMKRNLATSDRGQKDAGGSLSEEQKEELAAYYGFDRSFFPAYLVWLGVLPREADKQFIKFEEGTNEMPITLRELLPKAEWTPNNAYRVTQAKVTREGKLLINEPKPPADDTKAPVSDTKAPVSDTKAPVSDTKAPVSDTKAPANDPKALNIWTARMERKEKVNEEGKKEFIERALVFRNDFDGVLQGNLGYSTRYNDPVLEMILRVMPVSIFYGLVTFLLTYMVCIPLGILKAIKHRTMLDNVTSVLIFVGYAVPGFVLGSMLLVYLAARMGWFPTGGFIAENYEQLSAPGKVWDVIHHAILPLVCYMIGSFAFMTLLMKNNLMDNLAADFVRTAVAKGASFKTAVLKHALRNSLIPIATTFGHIVSIFVAGSLLIELIFEINGFGLLGYNSILDRDYPLVMGILLVDVVLLMLGNILSDFLVAVTDPRIRFH